MRDLLPELLGPHFGVIESLARVPVEPDDPEISVCAARIARTEALGAPAAPPFASGAGLEVEEAAAACAGEALERYAAAFAAPGAIVQARMDDLPARVAGEPATIVPPARFALFTLRQHLRRGPGFPFARWSPRDAIGWTLARSLATGRPAWVPAALVYQPYRPAPGETVFAPSLSTGLACARSWEGAVEAGLLEAIERDAVALAWLGRLAPPRIELDRAAGGGLEAIAGRLDATGLRWALFDLTTDLGAPVAAALVEGDSPVGSIVSFGAACRPEPARAAAKALLEAAHCRMYVKSLVREDPLWRAGPRFRGVRSFAHHARFYSTHAERRGALERWWRSARRARWPGDRDPRAPRGVEAYAVDLTTPELRGLGVRVARVLAPGLQPLHGDHRWPHLGGERLRKLRAVFGPAARRPWRWNRLPHPCP